MNESNSFNDFCARLRPLVERQVSIWRRSNELFMDAWRKNLLDQVWDEFRPAYGKDLRLHYFMRARGLGDIKIGKTNHPFRRYTVLSHGAPRGVDLLAIYVADKGHERELMDEFRAYRVNNEWHWCAPPIKDHLAMIGVGEDAYRDGPLLRRFDVKRRIAYPTQGRLI